VVETLDWEALKGLTTTVLLGITLIVVIPVIYASAIRTGWQGIKDTIKDTIKDALHVSLFLFAVGCVWLALGGSTRGMTVELTWIVLFSIFAILLLLRAKRFR
jgi:hypothetical protein